MSHKKKDKLILSFESELAKCIQKIEGISSVEVVPALLLKSSNYRGFQRYAALLAAFFTSLAFHYYQPLLSELWIILICFGVFMLINFVLGFGDLLSYIIPASVKDQKSLAKARELFLKERVFETRDRTGILIFVSVFEKRVLILADKGFKDKIEESTWSQLALKLATDFDKKNPGKTFIHAIESFGDELAQKFPVRSDDVNELSDKVRG